MKRDAIEELYDYTDFAWAMLAQTVNALPEGDLIKPVAGSGWASLREAFMHLMGSYDNWLHETLALGEFINPPGETLTSWGAVQEFRDSVRLTLRRLLDDAPDEKLYEEFTRTYDEDGPETLSLADIAANLLLHERGHHGDFSTLFYQLGAPPPFLDYRMYVYLKRVPTPPERPPGW